MSKLRELLPANRVAALIGVLTSIGVFLTTLLTSFVPGSPGAEAIGKAIVMLGSVIAVLRIVDKFLEGAQNFDSLMLAGVPKVKGVSSTAPVVDELPPGIGDTDLDLPNLDELEPLPPQR